ncbi:class I SAM-dependent methyltransferase [Fodinibius sediminis]|nr:methyltransferase domain-containing protein [Fodinibius sediminis]
MMRRKKGSCFDRWLMRGIMFFGLFLLISPAFVAAQNITDDVNWLIEVLKLEEGSVVADIGAGDGSISLALARHVGTNGKIYSSELGADSVRYLRRVVDSANVSNVTVMEGHPSRTNLPEQCCDALLLRRVYHHFKDPLPMNKSMLESLKPGGRLAVIDFEPRGGDSADPARRASASHHGVTTETVVKELRQAGFELVSSEQPAGRDVYVVVRKPGR